MVILDQIKKNNTIDTTLLIQQFPSNSISKETPAWVTYKEDRIVSNFIDELETKKIDFFGSEQEASEFTLRFILGQLGHDWEWTIMMIWEMIGDKFSLNFDELNNEMRNFDYQKFFK